MLEKSFIKCIKTEGYEEAHAFSYATIIIPDRLPVKLTVKGVKAVISPGEAAIINAGVVYEINSLAVRDVIHFDELILKENSEFTPLLPILLRPYLVKAEGELQKDENRDLYGWLKELRPEEEKPENKPYTRPIELLYAMISLRSGSFFYETKLRALLDSFFSLLGERIYKSIDVKPADKVLNHIALAIQYINENFDKEIELLDIAYHANYNKTHLSHTFKELYGMPLYDYLIRVRVGHACALIKESGIEVSELGKRSGFLSSSTLNRVFKKETGYSPREYRALLKE